VGFLGDEQVGANRWKKFSKRALSRKRLENAWKLTRLRLSLVLLGTKQELLARLVVSSETQPHKIFDCPLLFPVASSFLSSHPLQLVVQLTMEQTLSSRTDQSEDSSLHPPFICG